MTARALRRILPEARVVGDVSELTRASRVAIVASYSATPRVTRSLSALVGGLRLNGYSVLLVRATESGHALDWPAASFDAPPVVFKPNIGYDFGSWATGLALFPGLAAKDHVILANDSLIGPFGSLAPLVEDFESGPGDVWGATNTDEIFPHLQSYLLGFAGGVLETPAIAAFWRSIRAIADKDAIVARYEIGLSRLLANEGFLSRAWFDHSQIVPAGGNPTIVGGSRLLEAGFPFVKRILIENADIFPDAAEAAAVVRRLYGQELLDWT